MRPPGPLHSPALVLLLAGALTLVPRAVARDTPQPVDFPSSSADYVFRVTPQSDPNGGPGHCLGELLRVNAGSRERVWSRHLVNHVGIDSAAVSDDGAFVVTLDEWQRHGELPVVIYGRRGELIRVHTLDTLGLADDHDNVQVTATGRHWRKGSLQFFSPDNRRFFLRLAWGRLLVLDLRTGDVLHESTDNAPRRRGVKPEEWRALRDYADQRSAELAVALLASSDPDEQHGAALAVAQLKPPAAAPGLRKLLASEAHYMERTAKGPWRKVYHVRKAARYALVQLGEDPGDVLLEEDVRTAAP